MGLHRAGFEVVGVDIKPQPNYPFEFHQADALTFPLKSFDFIWASPPCQAFSVATAIHGRKHVDLLTGTRERLEANAAFWAIENVPGAPMRPDVMLCGSMFGQSRLRRHRLFELSFPVNGLVPPCAHGRNTVSVFGHGGHIYHPLAVWKEVMDIDWMTRAELAQAIPPAYGEFIGRQAIRAIERG